MSGAGSARLTRRTALGLLAASLPLGLSGCVLQGEATAGPVNGPDTLSIDYATYNPLSLVIRHQGWLEETLAPRGVRVNWVFSAGSNKANELLRSNSVDIGSTAGSAALLNRANGAPTRIVGIASRPEWSALMVPPGSDITDVAQLAGRTVAATRGTDPYFFAVQAIEAAGVDPATSRSRTCSTPTAAPPSPADRWPRGPGSTRSWPRPRPRAPASCTGTSP